MSIETKYINTLYGENVVKMVHLTVLVDCIVWGCDPEYTSGLTE